MGCQESRKEIVPISPEEDLIRNEEDNLGFRSCRSDVIDISFHRYSLYLKLNQTQFSAACKEINLDLSSYYDQASPLRKLINCFKNADSKTGDFLDTRRLSALGVLLGKGGIKEKAKVLFKNYDIEVSNTLDIKEMRI